MANEILKNRVRQTCQGTGTGDLDIGSGAAATGFRKVSDAYSIGESGIFVLESGSDYEIFYGTRSDSTTLTRDTVIESTNSNAKIVLDGGLTHLVYCDLDAAGYVFLNSSGIAQPGTAILRASAVSTISDLTAIGSGLGVGDAGVVYLVFGGAAANDGGGGLFRWNGSTWDRLYLRKLLKFATMSSADATPSVQYIDGLITAGTTTITNFDDGAVGQKLYVIRGTSDITLQHSASLDLGGSDIILTASSPSAQLLRVTEGSGSKWLVTGRSNVVLDEDDFASDSATNPPSQQSVKAYYAQTPNHTAATELTLSSGQITPTLAAHTVDTEDLGGSIGQLSTDDLDTIVNTNFDEGYILTLSAANSLRTVVIKHGTGNIIHPDSVDFSLDDATKTVFLRKTGSFWYVINAGVLLEKLSSSTNGEGASLIFIEDSGSLFSASNVETALIEVRKNSYISGGTIAVDGNNEITVAPRRRYQLTASDSIAGVIGLADGEFCQIIAPASGSTTLEDAGTTTSGQAFELSGNDKTIQSTDESVYTITRVGSAIRLSGGAGAADIVSTPTLADSAHQLLFDANTLEKHYEALIVDADDNSISAYVKVWGGSAPDIYDYGEVASVLELNNSSGTDTEIRFQNLSGGPQTYKVITKERG